MSGHSNSDPMNYLSRTRERLRKKILRFPIVRYFRAPAIRSQSVSMLQDSRLAQSPAQGATPAERVIDALDRALRAMGRQPQLVGAVFTALASPDPAAIECQQQVSVLMEGIITRAIGEPQPADISDRARILGHVWYSALVGWVNGWSNMNRVHDELVVAIGLLLPTDVYAEV